MKKHFDVIVVGGGLAGLSAAYVMAESGLDVIVLERGDYSGSKNMMGGILYGAPMAEVVPDFANSGPVERPVIEKDYWLLSGESAVKLGVRNDKFKTEPANSYTVLRAKFDDWFSKKVEEAGAWLITETTVTDLIRKDGRVVGVQTSRDDGDLYADLVIIAQGVNAILVEKAGLRPKLKMNEVATAVKELIKLDEKTIEDRFGLEPGEGTAVEIIGDGTMGLYGMAFLYTNKDTLSLGIGVMISEVVKARKNPNEILEHLKSHPVVRPLIAGGETIEYTAHMIPEGGYKSMPRLYTDGVLVVGDSAMMVNAIHGEGSNLAIISGKLAAETAIEAHRKGDFSSQTLAAYQRRLEASFILKDLKKYANLNDFMHRNLHFFDYYPKVANEALSEFFTVDSVPKKEKQRRIMQIATQDRSLWQVLRDMFGLWRSAW